MISSLFALSLRLVHLLRRLLDNERAIAELRRLDAGGLTDLGITHAQIRDYVGGRLRPSEGSEPIPQHIEITPRRLRPMLQVIRGGSDCPAGPTAGRPAPALRLAAVRV